MRLTFINFLKFLLNVEDTPAPKGCEYCPHCILNKQKHDGSLGMYAQAKGIHGTHYEFDQIRKPMSMAEHDKYHHDGGKRDEDGGEPTVSRV